MEKVLVEEVASAPTGADAAALPERVQEALGELAAAAKEGLLALSVGVGLGVLTELMEEEVDEAVGPRGKHDPDRVAVRHGHEAGEVTLGGRRVAVERPRARSADGGDEVPLAAYRHFADRDALSRVGARADARWRLDASLPAHLRAGRRGDRARRPLDLEVGGQPRVRRPHAREP